MSKHVFSIAVLSLIAACCTAQKITVKKDPSTGEITIPRKEKSFKYTTPFSFIFDEPVFKGKTISFYTDKVEAKKFLEVTFGSSDLGKKTVRDTSFYEITVGEDLMIPLKENNEVLSGGTIFFKIDPGSFIGPVNFDASGTPQEPKNRDKTSKYAPGLIFLDAMKLNELKISKNNSDSLGKLFRLILDKYQINNKATLLENKFLETVFRGAFDGVESSQDQAKSFLSTALSSVGGLDVTNIADGFAKFIVKRTKQELSIAFFEKFKKEIEKYPDLKTVFPNTFNLLEAIGQEIYNYSNYLNNLREAFRSDLQAIDENLPGIVDNHPEFFKKKNNFELGLALKTGCYVSTSLRHDVHPGDILDGYPVSFFDSSKMPPEDSAKLIALKGAIQSLQLLSESLKENSSDTSKHAYWVGIDKIRQLVNDQDALKIYLGLLLQVAHIKYQNIQFSGRTNFYDLLNSDSNVANFDIDYPAYKQYILTFGSKLHELSKMIKEYEKPVTDSLKVEQYAKYFKSSVEFLQYCIQVTKLPHIRDIPLLKDFEKKTQNYFDIAFETTDLATAINRKRYPEVVNHLIVIYNKVVTRPALNSATLSTTALKMTSRQRKELAENLISANASNPNTTTTEILGNFSEIGASISSNRDLLSKEQTKKLVDTLIQINAANPGATTATVMASVPNVSALVNNQSIEFANAGKVLSSLAKYGAFMSSMINAKSSDEVAEAIEAVALPVGSAKIKRATPFNVSLNAYCGLFIGNEVIKGVDHENPFYKFNAFGVTAPVGISISRGNDYIIPYVLKRKNYTYGWSHSLFISLVDLGAITAYRFTDETTAQVPTIQLKDIFSPGLFWSLGVPKTPLSVNLGAQVGPNLRKVKSTANDYAANTYVRYSVSVCVDLPLLNLYTKSN